MNRPDSDQVLLGFFEGTTPFTCRRKGEGVVGYNLKDDYFNLLLPYIKSVGSLERQGLTRSLAEAAVGSKFRENHRARVEAMEILSLMSHPWPEDNRSLLLPAREVLCREFGKEGNVKCWSRWEDDGKRTGWTDGPGFALSLYSILLTIMPLGELRKQADLIIESARDRRFRIMMQRLPELRKGIRFGDRLPTTEREYIHTVQAALRRRQNRLL